MSGTGFIASSRTRDLNGGPRLLGDILEVFLSWASKSEVLANNGLELTKSAPPRNRGLRNSIHVRWT